jgi:hypothetical protein
MAGNIQVIGDPDSYPAVSTDSDGNSTVYAHSILVLVNGSSVVDHVPRRGGFVHTSVKTANGASTVFAHGVPVNYLGNPDTCGHVRSGSAAPTVFVGEGVELDTPVARAVNELDETDALEPGSADKAIQAHIASGTISAGQLAVGDKPIVGKKELTTSTAGVSVPLSTDCSDIASLSPFPSGNDIDAIQISTNYTVGTVTRKPYVVFDHALRDGTGGLSLEEIVCNLKMVAINILEPMRAQYSNLQLTNTWRPAGIGSSTSQHPKGMACDMQFKGVPKKEYFEIAKWCRDNLLFDQLLLEYKTTGSGLPWIHMSFNKNNNRKQVLTLLNDKTHSQGLVDLSQT